MTLSWGSHSSITLHVRSKVLVPRPDPLKQKLWGQSPASFAKALMDTDTYSGLRAPEQQKETRVQAPPPRQVPALLLSHSPRALQRTGNMNQQLFPLLSSFPLEGNLPTVRNSQPSLEFELVFLGNNHQPNPSSFSHNFMFLPRIMWRWTHSRSSA